MWVDTDGVRRTASKEGTCTTWVRGVVRSDRRKTILKILGFLRKFLRTGIIFKTFTILWKNWSVYKLCAPFWIKTASETLLKNNLRDIAGGESSPLTSSPRMSITDALHQCNFTMWHWIQFSFVFLVFGSNPWGMLNLHNSDTKIPSGCLEVQNTFVWFYCFQIKLCYDVLTRSCLSCLQFTLNTWLINSWCKQSFLYCRYSIYSSVYRFCTHDL